MQRAKNGATFGNPNTTNATAANATNVNNQTNLYYALITNKLVRTQDCPEWME